MPTAKLLATSPCGQATMAFGNTALPASTDHAVDHTAGAVRAGRLPAAGRLRAGRRPAPGLPSSTSAQTVAGGATTPSGTVYVTLYSDPTCRTQVAAPGGAQLQNGVASVMAAVSLPV